jgi:hypothetical protein
MLDYWERTDETKYLAQNVKYRRNVESYKLIIA